MRRTPFARAPLPRLKAPGAAPSRPTWAAPSHNLDREAQFADSIERAWSLSLAFCQPERLALGDRRYQGRKAIITSFNLLHYLIDRTTVLHGKFPPEAEGKHFFGQATH